ncbi:aminopeptidase P family protein [Membranihabitans marinus]
MFVDAVYRNRRGQLKNHIDTGVIWLQGNREIGMNYRHNAFPFRQDSNILYYSGLDLPDIHIIIDIDKDREILFGEDLSVEQTVWVGQRPSLAWYAEQSGISEVLPLSQLEEYLSNALRKNRIIHTLPTYHAYHDILIHQYIRSNHRHSVDLIKAIVAQRSIKEDREIHEIEQALSVTAKAHKVIRENANAGMTEQSILSKAMEVVIDANCRLAYPAIITVHGEILHSNRYENILSEGQLLLCDLGVENQMHYASDITRTIPVNRIFTGRQKEVYDLVLKAKDESIERLRPGIAYKEVHTLASVILAQGLVDIGLLKGDADEIVAKGAHALFFPHGLGHMMGMDVHDMEGLGEKYVGYNKIIEKSDQFGINHLRLGRNLQKGNVITVEPGIYFIPALIDSWQSQNKFPEHISYSELKKWSSFGGIRLEDNVVITSKKGKILGPAIPC